MSLIRPELLERLRPFREAMAAGIEHDEEGQYHWKRGESPCRWRPSIFMPTEATRIFLRVTEVRAERLQDITEADALREGVSRLYDYMTKEDFEKWAKNVGHKKTQSEESFTNYLWHGHFGQYGMGNKQSDVWEYQYSDYPDARGSFSSLWHMINAARGYGWDTNPWVWVYEFERIGKEEAEKLEGKA